MSCCQIVTDESDRYRLACSQTFLELREGIHPSYRDKEVDATRQLAIVRQHFRAGR